LLSASKGVSFGGWNSNFSEDYKFNEKLTYDLRGNIITLQRNGLNSNGWTSNHFVAGTYGRIDNLTYAYNTKNQLLSVNEASLPTRGFKTNPNATGNQYGYDGNGNLIFDKNKYIASIEYNYLNLPIKVVIDNPTDAVNSGSIEFIYDATGTKLRKTVKNKDGSVKETWDYVNGVEYKNQILQRVAHSEGAVVRNDFGQYQHEYVLRDHLGNTRVTFTDGVNKGEPYWDWSNYSYIAPDNTGYDDGVVTEADIKHINHTYPFGMAMEGNWNNAGSANNNRYLYNGKQYNDDFGMGWYDYGARFYDPSIARWSAVDPLAEKYKHWSGYNYCLDNPIKFIDPDGMRVINGDKSARDGALATRDDAQKRFDAKYEGDKNKDRKSFESKAEYKAYKAARSELKSAEKALTKAEANYKLTESRIQDFKSTDPEGFAQADNLTYKAKDGLDRKIDVSVKSGYSSKKGETNLILNPETGIIKSITITIDDGQPIQSRVLAHELGHSVAMAKSPIAYRDAVKASPEHDCQDPNNRHSLISETAVDWQERYDILKKQ
jgi:RHS repeat-associated protein